MLRHALASSPAASVSREAALDYHVNERAYIRRPLRNANGLPTSPSTLVAACGDPDRQGYPPGDLRLIVKHPCQASRPRELP